MKIAFVTCSAFPELWPDDQKLAAEVQKRGIEVCPAIWNDPEVDWSSFELAVIRSTWDYAEQAADFLAWGEQTSRTTRLLNPFPVIQKNADKRYLIELAKSGVATVPSLLLERGSQPDIDAIMLRQSWDAAIIKPVVGQSSRHVYRVSGADSPETRGPIESLFEQEDFLIQPFMSSIAEEGEMSLVFIDGSLTHGVLKRVAEGGLYVQEELGGSSEPYEPCALEIEVAESALSGFQKLLYARVDLIPSPKGPLLSELELIEPELFLRFSDEAMKRLGRAIAR